VLSRFHCLCVINKKRLPPLQRQQQRNHQQQQHQQQQQQQLLPFTNMDRLHYETYMVARSDLGIPPVVQTYEKTKHA